MRNVIYSKSLSLGSPRRRGWRGFTLIELLVVVSIIALLVAILLPSLANAREAAKRIRCMANFHSIGLGMHMYADENNDRFPDRWTTGGFPFRAKPGWRDASDPRGLPEIFGLAAVLDDNNIIAADADCWVCPAQPHGWMRDVGNTYAFSVAGILATTYRSSMSRFRSQWLVWDNYIYYPYTPGWRAGGTTTGFTIPVTERKYVHAYGAHKDNSRAINVLFMDGHTAPQFEQP